MKSKISIILLLLLCIMLFTVIPCAFAESEHQAMTQMQHDALILGENYFGPTPNLGDSSIATVMLVGLAVLSLAGAILAHRKARSNAR